MPEQKITQPEGTREEIEIRGCETMVEYDQCITLQREAFALPDMEISPRRHLIVTRRAGGWTLGAFAGDRMVGFVHHMIGVRGANEIIGYSHMMAVAPDYQNKGVGAKLKWAQRARALSEGRNFIKWTWDPMQARNAHFNLNRLGVTVRSYGTNFYGTDYITMPHATPESANIDSDRLFADWLLDSRRVRQFSEGTAFDSNSAPVATIEIPPDWSSLISRDTVTARSEQLRVRAEFEEAFAAGLICAGFERDKAHPRYLLYKSDEY